MPILIFRVDANSSIGAGHIMRCLAIAQAWKAVGRDVFFFGRIESSALQQRIAAAGFKVMEPGPTVQDTIDLLISMNLARSWVMLDGYHFGPEWQSELAKAGFRVAVIDDGARLEFYAAEVIVAPDQMVSSMVYPTYDTTLILAGPHYRLLRSGFTQVVRPSRGKAGGMTVLVSFGGADSANATCAVVLALSKVLGPQDRVLVILGPVNRHSASVQQALAKVGYAHELHCDVADMAALFARVDLAVSAAGGAAWEMVASGLPAVLVAVAENQTAGMEYLVRVGAAVGLSGLDALNTEEFPTVIRTLLESEAQLVKMSDRGRAACDGRGAARVCAILASLGGDSRAEEFVLRKAEQNDMDQIFRLANDSDVRANSFSPQRISYVEHATWFADRLASSQTVIFVLDLAGAIVALARFDQTGDAAEIDFAVHPAFRGRGLGIRVLLEAVPRAVITLGVGKLLASVLESNTASQRCFIRAGFMDAGNAMVKGRLCRQFSLTVHENDTCLA